MATQLTRTQMLHNEAPRLQPLLRAIRNSHVCVLYQTPDLAYVWEENLPILWQSRWAVGGNDYNYLPENHAARVESTKRLVLEDAVPRVVEISVNDSGQMQWFEFYIDCDRDEHGKTLGIVTTVLEISELKRREQVLTTLLREVSHRSKNLLSIIQSIATQTARFTGSVDQFLLKFRGRIQSLSYSQDLVTDSNWRGALFRDLVHSQIGRYLDRDDHRLTIQGSNPYLFPNAALHIGLALHELIVNATSHGGLAHNNGSVTVSAEIIKNEQGIETLIFLWQEADQAAQPNDVQPSARFGSAVLQRIVPSSVNGVADYHRDRHGVTYRLTLADNQFGS